MRREKSRNGVSKTGANRRNDVLPVQKVLSSVALAKFLSRLFHGQGPILSDLGPFLSVHMFFIIASHSKVI
ncbi:MAG: hypothetical protein A3D44_01170 [Candidatus Staskawiczbacteria bacterium RIFCSPHIGHO2_02_FULL_42_22]|uniref:Uncharacterized protein n=1 Tax=Candidatus Staskawiczbacteria bacterium RIFCSPHIGHO2_02_FULL_42_22 TaxID=1802207 RepID=A0A1G2I378_9BACT|nr:MAG: hypothetical protein A3D44_01170 [Candidatus Staskawiczbacteria bacterium RIFCSPHIGHO2_02_FULL_42_22]